MSSITVKSPATSANLGPGFDCFGIAWDLYNEISFEHSEEDCITGCEEKYQNKDNLAYTAFCKTLEVAGKGKKGVHIHFGECNVPTARGLGSSAALICAGIKGANALYNLKLSKAEMLDIATELEGHPDNAAPAIYGGFCASVCDEGKVTSVQYTVSSLWHFAALIPPFELSTAVARGVMPDTYTKKDAVFNIGRTALMIKAMESGDPDILGAALQDRIHQPYRFPLIPGADKADEICKTTGAAGMCISGAGSTLLVFAAGENVIPSLQKGIPEALEGWRVIPLNCITDAD